MAGGVRTDGTRTLRMAGGLEPQRSRGPHARLLLTRASLASNRRPATCGTR